MIGIAACNIGGVTIHSFAGIGLGTESAKHLADKIMKNKFAFARWARTRVLIIRKNYCNFSVREPTSPSSHACNNLFFLFAWRVAGRKKTGVPRTNVARLLDWFDDIVNLHEQIYQSI